MAEANRVNKYFSQSKLMPKLVAPRKRMKILNLKGSTFNSIRLNTDTGGIKTNQQVKVIKVQSVAINLLFVQSGFL